MGRTTHRKRQEMPKQMDQNDTRREKTQHVKIQNRRSEERRVGKECRL